MPRNISKHSGENLTRSCHGRQGTLSQLDIGYTPGTLIPTDRGRCELVHRVEVSKPKPLKPKRPLLDILPKCWAPTRCTPKTSDHVGSVWNPVGQEGGIPLDKKKELHRGDQHQNSETMRRNRRIEEWPGCEPLSMPPARPDSSPAGACWPHPRGWRYWPWRLRVPEPRCCRSRNPSANPEARIWTSDKIGQRGFPGRRPVAAQDPSAWHPPDLSGCRTPDHDHGSKLCNPRG